MARPTVFSHPKLKRLAFILQISPPAALGHLEFVWHVANESGEPVIGDAVDVELAAGWTGEVGAFCKAAAEVGFIDADGEVFAIHDFWHHAPEYVRKRRDRELARVQSYDGQYPPKTAEKPPAADSGGRTADNGGHCRQNGAPPSPSPSPSPKKRKTLLATGDPGPGSFDRFWSAYPRKVKRAKAQEAWDKLDPAPELVTEIMAALKLAKASADWTKDNGEYIPHPTTWLNGRRWEDEVDPANANDNRTEFEKAFDALPRRLPKYDEVAAVMDWDQSSNGQAAQAVTP